MKRVLILFFLLANFATMAQRRIGIQDYSTVAALQAETINPSQNDKVYVKALQAVFAWDAASTATHDGVTVIKQTNITTGRFLLVGTSSSQLAGKLDATDTTTLLRKTTAAATYQPKGNYGLLGSNNVWSGNNSLSKVIFPQNASWESYNTADQTTNFERVRAYWTGNSFNIRGEYGGTGQLRNIYIGNNNPFYINASGQIILPDLSNGLQQQNGFVLSSSATAPIMRPMNNVPYDLATNGSTSAIRIHTDGVVGINTLINSGFRLDVNGTARFTGRITATQIESSVDGGGDIGISGKAFGVVRVLEHQTERLIERYSGSGLSFINSGSGTKAYMFPVTGNFHFQNGGTYTDIPSARVAVNSTTQGFLPPRMTALQRNAIASPATGLIVYCTDCVRLDGGSGVLQSYNGTSWISAERRRSVLDYGATPNDGTDDTAAFLACISAEKEVYIPRGLFLVGTLTVPSDRKVYGDGASTILKANVNNARIFNIYNSSLSISNVTIQDLKIDGGGQTTDLKTGIRAAYGVYVSNATNVNIVNLVIDKCGVIHPTTDTLDNGYGGYGIMVEARGGGINNITIEKCRVTNIAGGGMVAGDGIYIAGYSSSTLLVPRNIYVRNCSVENVGRHCFTVAGERGVINESFGENVHFSDCNCRNAALSGVDLEEGSFVNISTMTIENAGNYTGYYNPTTIYGANYRLCTGIAYGNLSVHNSYKNIKIKKSYYGITLGAGEYNHFDEIQIDSSTVADIILRLSHIGNNLTISNSRFLTPNLTAFNVYNPATNSRFVIQNCYFASPVNLTGVQYARFNNTVFNAPVNFTSTENGKNEFVGCTFNQKVEFQINDLGFHTFDRCLFVGTTGLYFNTFATYVTDVQAVNSEFRGNQYGIYAVWKSIKNMKVDNCKFIGNTTASIYHANSDNEAPFLRISGNTFSNTVDAISINQATKFTKIADNTFRGVSGWCIKNTTILSGSSTTDLQILNNQALSSCVNGIQIEVQTGSHDYNIIRGNNMRVCTGTKANISAGNSNGFQAENFF